MKRVILVYGGIAGVIVAVYISIAFALIAAMGGSPDFMQGKVVNYTCQVLAMSFIFIAVHTYKNNILGGTIRFWPALKVGLLISLIASTFYVIAWVLIFKFGNGEAHLDAYMAEGMKNMTDEEIKKSEALMKFYKTWPGLISITYSEVLPTGIIMSLISAIFFALIKRKPKSQNETVNQ